MTTKAQQSFLKRERKNADDFFKPEFLADLHKDEQELKTLARQAPNAAFGRRFPAGMNALRTRHSAEGIVRLFDGDVSGFQRLREAEAVAYWQALVYEAAFERDTTPDRFRRGFSITAFAECLLALHLDARETADAVMRRLVAESHDSHCNSWKISTGALPFMIRLYELFTKQRVDIDWKKLPPLGGYELLLSDECQGQSYERALEWACDEHIAQTIETKKKPMPFAFAVFAPLPVELVLWLRCRKKNGLEHATHGHPLLESPLAAIEPPPSTAPPSDLIHLLELGIPHMQAYLDA